LSQALNTVLSEAQGLTEEIQT